ncbi:hypothetical protein SMKI_12G0260 [Saccharomyces mikatae IFO 1815]|uniref:Cystathionine gamma-synthase n=1 Tax=Saccharomyces mikatae IFO 1815 TaxID=226126 RepID=A0AA35NBS2_SACMI|nr:uncharacterized protein SMKI_12G0260 [Saccharomyces mikatae IFO 1815]CAI4034890.1 hypothetical protein SMKI_12G0260 [Saccharomyces mikatae IFO 1815]
MTDIEFGQALPRDLDYAVSFGIPTWDSAIGYAEKIPEVISRMATGYPRYFPQPAVQSLCAYFIKTYGRHAENCRPFPSVKLGLKCLEFVKSVAGSESKAHLEVKTVIIKNHAAEEPERQADLVITIAAVLAPEDEFEIVKEYWKLRGECVSSRLAQSFNQLLDAAHRGSSLARHEVEAKLVAAMKEGEGAKNVIKRRIVENRSSPFDSEKKNANWKGLDLIPEEDVHLVSSGMSAISTARDLLTFWEEKKNSNEGKGSLLCDTVGIFGFPFKDTQVIMTKFGKCKFFGFGDSRDITELQKFLGTSKQRILAVFVETPSNPLLNMPNLKDLRRLADQYGFFIIIDDTIGGINVDILPYADIVCTSLTKLFNGASNVMGGSIVLNPKSSIYPYAREYFKSADFEDLLWCEDAVVLERNSRDFENRTLHANANTEKLLNEVLIPEQGKLCKKVYYPTVTSEETFRNYESVRNERGGYGCLFSVAFYNEGDAKAFYDSLKVFKGPSNGTNFTLACPYVHLAHHSELEAVSKFGADPNIIRVSVGLEDTQWLLEVFSNALDVVRGRNFQHS